MKTKILLLAGLASCFISFNVRADLIEEEPAYPDNTGAINAGDNAQQITGDTENQNVSGAQNGEITIRRTDTGVEVYSSFNKVEVILSGSDGWVGRVDDQSSKILFQPMGRPELECPAQATSGWYGPCKVPDEGN